MFNYVSKVLSYHRSFKLGSHVHLDLQIFRRTVSHKLRPGHYSFFEICHYIDQTSAYPSLNDCNVR